MKEPSPEREATGNGDVKIAPTSGSYGPLGYLLIVIFFATSARLLPSKQAMWNTMPGCSDPGIVVSATVEVLNQAAGFAIQRRV